MKEILRKSGVDFIEDFPWGTHFCQFYQTKEDLIDILVPYFKAGLENNEFCMWITSEPLDAEDAKQALKKAVKDLNSYIKKGQIEILDYTQWYTKTGEFNTDIVLNGWIEKEKQASKNGFSGLRLTGNTFWLEEKDWEDFTDYEEKINNVIGNYKMIALCTYSLDKCSASDIIDVVKNHQFALIKQDEKWKSIESSENISLRESLKESEAEYYSLFDNMIDGFAYHKILLDETEKPIDYIFLEVNDAFGQFTGLKREDLIGKRVTQALPGIENDPADWIGIYGKVALTGDKIKFENYSTQLDRWYSVSAYSPERGYFITVFEDVTERKQAEQSLLQANERLEMAQRASRAGTWDWNVITNHIEWSSELIKLFGLDPQKTIPSFEVWNNILHPDDLKIANQRIEKALKGRTNLDSEYRIVLPDGQIRWINALGQGIYDDQDRPIRMIGICIDITNRKQIEDALRENEYQYRHLVQTANSIILRLDIKGNITFINEYAQKFFGYEENEIIGKSIFGTIISEKAITERDLGELVKIIITNPDECYLNENENIRRNGKRVWVTWSNKAIIDENDQVIGILAVGIDVTARKHAEQALEIAHQEAL
ncbi:MAG: hypothetical protein QG641_2641, partial [Candidatus Poribacteria bacterium]|nr:hypothetical protein [Candidatus Poribacteria bacterium]